MSIVGGVMTGSVSANCSLLLFQKHCSIHSVIASTFIIAHCRSCSPWISSYQNQKPCHHRAEFWKWQLLSDVLDPTNTASGNICQVNEQLDYQQRWKHVPDWLVFSGTFDNGSFFILHLESKADLSYNWRTTQ